MKYVVTLLTMLFISTITAQKAQEGLEKDFMNYSTLLLDGQYETAMDYVPAKIFEIVPKAVLIETFTMAMNSKEFEMKLVMPTFNTFEKSFEIDGVLYQTFTYNQELSMRFLTEDDENEEEQTVEEKQKDKKITDEFRLELFQVMYGKDAVTYDETTNFYHVAIAKQAVALKAASDKTWSFVVIEEGKKMLMEKVFPKKVIKKLYP